MAERQFDQVLIVSQRNKTVITGSDAKGSHTKGSTNPY
jgi:hypothetical protein